MSPNSAFSQKWFSSQAREAMRSMVCGNQKKTTNLKIRYLGARDYRQRYTKLNPTLPGQKKAKKKKQRGDFLKLKTL